MVEVRFDKNFKTTFSKLKDRQTRQRVIKQVSKISENPRVGKPMRKVRKGTRELHVKPFRLSYHYDESKGVVWILDLYHKKAQ